MSPSTYTVDAAVQLIPASAFSIEQLTQAYNQTRVDYLVPMPMNAARLAEYVHIYDIDLRHSCVAMSKGHMLGLGMLGVRADRVWITRLGVLTANRRRGIGDLLMCALLKQGQSMGTDSAILEVIKDNMPAFKLFIKLGFQSLRELLILRRPPGPPSIVPAGKRQWLDHRQILTQFERYPMPRAWTNQQESLTNANDVLGLSLTLPDGACGTLVFQRQRFVLARLLIFTKQGDPTSVGFNLLAHLYQCYPDLDTHVENIALNDPHLSAFFKSGFVESFRRIEMQRRTNGHT